MDIAFLKKIMTKSKTERLKMVEMEENDISIVRQCDL